MENDLWYNKITLSTNNRAHSFGVWLKETVDISQEFNGQIVAEALWLVLAPTLPPILGPETFMESVCSWRRVTGPGRPGQLLNLAGVGTRPGRSMSNDNALYINLRQDEVNARFNGGIYVGGLSENDQDNNTWNDTFLNGPVQTFLDVFDAPVVANSPAQGSWAFVVVSKAFNPAAAPPGTPFEVFKAVASTRVNTQRRRRQKITGWSN